jgi:hypothetical protein
MVQSKGKKTTTINIDKINGIENENEIEGFVITDEIRERFSNGFSESLKTFKNAGIDFAELTKGLNVPIGLRNTLIQSIGTQIVESQKKMEGYTLPMQGIGTRLSSLLAESGISGVITIPSIGTHTQIGLGLNSWITPEIQESFGLISERMKELGKSIYESINKAHPELKDFFNEATHLTKEEANKEFLDYIHWKQNFKDEYDEMYLRMESNLKARGCILPNLTDFFQFYVLSCRTLYGFSYLDFARHTIDKKDFILYDKYENLMIDLNLNALEAIRLLENENNPNIQLLPPLQVKEIAEGKVKVGRPESKKIAIRNQLIYNDYLKLTIDGDTNVRGNLLIIHKKIFNHPNHETNRRNLDRIINKMEKKMKDIN